jgi:hypothetical protein
MFSRKFFGGVAVGAAILAAAICQASASTFTDGEFNAPPGSAPFQTIDAGGSLGVWTVGTPAGASVPGSVDFINGYWQSPPTGGNSVDLDGLTPGSISQTFTSAGGTDVLSFYLSGNPDGIQAGDPNAKELQVTISTSTGYYTYTLNPLTNSKGNMEWAYETLAFSGGGSTTVTFTSLDNTPPYTGYSGFYGPVVGGIGITPIPAALPLFAGGLGLLGLVTRRRKRNGGAAVPSRLGLAA